jgi:hypothetical protein
MRGSDAVAGSLFSYVDLEKRVRADHPLRVIRGIVNATLAALSAEFDALAIEMGRQIASVLYVAAMIAVIVSVDLLFFRNRFLERLPDPAFASGRNGRV